MSYFNDTPHTKIYDEDLGWLIAEYKRLKASVEDLQKRVKRLEELYSSIPDEIQKATDEMLRQVNAAISAMQSAVQKQIDDMNASVSAKLAEIDARADALEQLVQEKVLEFEEMVKKMNALYLTIQRYVDTKVDYMQAWVKAYLKEWTKTWPWLVDPTDGFTEDLQTILWHMYNELSFGIPVNEFDAMNIPAQVFDNRKIIVACFDRWGKVLFRDWQCCRMYSPFSGERVPIEEVVLDLTRMHMNAVTCGEFDDAQIVVQVFDDKAIHVRRFDWTTEWFDELSADNPVNPDSRNNRAEDDDNAHYWRLPHPFGGVVF